MAIGWVKSQNSRLLIPAYTVEKTEFRTNILDVDALNAHVAAVRSLFAKYEIPNFKISDLGRLADDVQKVALKISTTQHCFLHINNFLDGLYFVRIANAISLLDGHPRAVEHLKKLIDGSIRMRKRELSVAKNTFWELEMLKRLRDSGIQSDLVEPPDIVWTLDGLNSGIACKKLYSLSHVQKVLSKAVSQIKNSGGYGLVAFNLDDRMPNGAFRAPTNNLGMAAVKQIAEHFLCRNRNRFSSYARDARLLGVVVSVTSVSFMDQPAGYLPCSLENYWTIWIPANLPKEHLDRINLFRLKIEGQQSGGKFNSASGERLTEL